MKKRQSINIRIGQGYDVHQLVEGRDLILDGVHVPSEKGLLGHFDADALLRALTDALLGAVGLGDIGNHFPDIATEFRDADSRVLLYKAYQSVQALDWHVVNMDTAIVTQKLELAPHTPAMRADIAADLGVQTTCVSIKSKVNGKLGYLGRMKAIETQVAVLLQKADTP